MTNKNLHSMKSATFLGSKIGCHRETHYAPDRAKINAELLVLTKGLYGQVMADEEYRAALQSE
jgi:hypothetical protein